MCVYLSRVGRLGVSVYNVETSMFENIIAGRDKIIISFKLKKVPAGIRMLCIYVRMSVISIVRNAQRLTERWSRA